MWSDGLTISPRAALDRPSPRTSAAMKVERSAIVVSIEPATDIGAFIMLLRFALVVPPVGQIRPEVRAPLQAGARHPQPHEQGIGQVLDVHAQSLRSGSLL